MDVRREKVSLFRRRTEQERAPPRGAAGAGMGGCQVGRKRTSESALEGGTPCSETVSLIEFIIGDSPYCLQ